MASPAENMATIDPWAFRPSFADSWISEAFAIDTETLTRALQKSISNSFSNFDSFHVGNILGLINLPTTTTLTTSTFPGSDLETSPERRRMTNPPPTGKLSKRKSRSKKRSQTTFITADPANFKQMVQQVTGVGFSNANMCSSLSPILKPEPQRPVNRLQNGAAAGSSGYLPTLDTSAFLLDYQQASAGGMGAGSSSLPFHSSVLAETAFSTGANLVSDSFPSFPTLESSKA